jgi:hypothetical protein
MEKLHAKIAQLVVERIFWRKPAVDERGPEGAIVDSANHRLSISAQCRLLSISRSSYYYAPVREADERLALMTVIDETFISARD